MRKLLLLICLLGMTAFINAQDFTNKGKDFWIGYGNHVRMFTGGQQETMQLYITSDVNTTGQISIQGIAGFPQNFTVTANQITTVNIPRSAALMDEGLYNYGIHVTAQKPVVVYSFIYVNAVSGATLCLPTNTLGREYYSINFDQTSNEQSSSYSYFFAVAADTGVTTLEIRPSRNTRGNQPAWAPFNVNLSQGQVYQVLASSDLSGSTIRSINTGAGCKRIAVFSGSGKISIGCVSAGSSDNLYQQMYPTATWGKTYVTVPSVNQPGLSNQFNYIRIFKSDPAAVVKYNGNILPAGSFINGQYLTLPATNQPGFIESDMQIMVAQYFTTQGCSSNSGDGDPEMIYLNPVEQTVSSVTLNSMQPVVNTNINQHYINVAIKTSAAALSSFRIDGAGYASSFKVHPAAPGYSYAQIPVSQGTHTITCDTPFNAISYGFGNAESYGYSAGTNLKDLYQYVSVQNDYAIVNFPAGCKGSPFKFSMTFPYQPTKITWKFNGVFTDTTILNPVPDSSWVINNRTLYRYPLARSNRIDVAGTYPISVLATNPTADGCSGEQQIDYDLQIFDRPVAGLTFTHTGCIGDSVPFMDNTNGLGRPLIKYYWDFGDASFSDLKNPKHKYNTAGSFTVKHAAITDIGCLSDTVQAVVPIADPPVAGFTLSAITCEKKAITFTDGSTTPSGTIVKWNWNFGDGITISAGNNNPVTHTYAVAGTYTATLLVESSSGCKSQLFSTVVTVHVNPRADFALPAAVCLPAGTASFTDQSTISDGTQAQMTFAWDFGDVATSNQQNPVHAYTAVGPYTVKLTVTSNNNCTHDTAKIFNTIYPQPKADFDVTAEVCLGAAVQFTDKSDGKGSTVVQWRWDYGNGQTAALQNNSYTYATANTYYATLSIVTDKGCVSDTMTKPTVVNPLPSANFNFSSPACETSIIQFTDASAANAGALTKWTWNLGNGKTDTVQNPTNTYTTPNTYDVTLVVASSKGCISSLLTKQVKINYLPVPNFGMPEVCLNDPTAQFSDSSTIGDGSEAQFNYLWNFGDGFTSTAKNAQHKYTAVGNYTIALTVTSKDGCSKSVSKAFTVNGSIPQAGFAVSNSSDLCVNRDVTVSDASMVDFGSIVKVEVYWDYLNDPTIKTVDEVPVPGRLYTHKYPDFGNPATQTFQVRYVAYSGINCISQSVQTITVKASPEIQFDAMTGVCEEILPFVITAAKEIYGFAGTGTFTGPGISQDGTFRPKVARPGIHTIRYSFAAVNGCSTYKDQTLQVYPTPFVDAGPDRGVLEGGNVILQPKASGNGLSYLWTPPIGIDNPESATPKVSPPDDITYTLTVTSVNGCVAKDEVFVKVLRKPLIPNVFTPNGDAINDTWVITYLDTYPGCTVDVYNRYGQRIYSSIGYGKPWDGRVNGNPVPVGTYYWVINPKNGREQMTGSVTIIR
jgi:gliding motility-associated-like protein